MSQTKTPNCYVVTQNLTDGSLLVFTDFVPEIYIDLAAARDRRDELNDGRRAYCGYYYDVTPAELKQ